MLAAAAVIKPVDTAEAHAHAAELVQRARTDADRFDTGIVSNLIRAGRLDQAQAAAEAALTAARAGGFIQRHASMLGMRGWISLERGELAEARDDLEGALALAPDVALPPPVTKASAAMLALVLAEQGEFAHADALLDQHDLAGELPEHQVMNLLLTSAPACVRCKGRADEAREDALEVGRRYARLGIRRAVPAWRSLTGDEALAREEVELAERWGTPLARGLALRGLGLATGDERRCATPSPSSRPHPTGSSSPARRSSSARCCAATAAAPRPGSRCASGWTVRTPAARSRSPSAPAPSCSPPARDREGSLSKARTH